MSWRNVVWWLPRPRVARAARCLVLGLMHIVGGAARMRGRAYEWIAIDEARLFEQSVARRD
jgi:hypothetical protein